MNFADMKAFHTKYIKDKKYNLSVVGDKDKMNFKVLNQYGEVVKLSLEEVFGYEEHVGEVLN